MPLPPALAIGFAALALAMAVVLVWGAWAAPADGDRQRAALLAAGVAGVYLGVSAALAATGVLARLAPPPPVAVMLVLLSAGVVGLAFSPLGDRLLAWPLAVLVGAQSFRIVVEALLAAAYHAGSVPVEVTVEGWNFDLVTGLGAAALGLWLWRGRPPRGVVLAWNVLGLVLLAVVVGTSAASAFGALETSPRMTLPTTWPGVWLPAWLVQLALFGHVLVFRKLARPAGPTAAG